MHERGSHARYDKGEQIVSYPVTFEADYVERRNRLTAFFRLILAIPLCIWLLRLRIVAEIALVIAWFAIVITGRYPRGLYDFVAGFTRFATRSPPTRAALRPLPLLRRLADDPAYPCGWSSSRSSTTAA